MKLVKYEYNIVYKAGTRKVNVDALSRNPVEMSKQILPLVGSNTDNRHSEPRGSPTLTDAIKTLFKTHDNTDNDKSHDDSEITSEEYYTYVDDPL